MPNVGQSTDNAVVTITFGPLTVPGGSVVANLVATCVGAATGPQPNQVLAPTVTSFTFAGLAADTYTITCQAFPGTGAGFGTPATTTITITVPSDITIQVPASLSATQP